MNTLKNIKKVVNEISDSQKGSDMIITISSIVKSGYNDAKGGYRKKSSSQLRRYFESKAISINLLIKITNTYWLHYGWKPV